MAMTQAALKACYADWKLIKTRSTVQLVFEVPVEQSGLAYEVLGGMPQPGSEVWCAIARLQQPKEVMPTDPESGLSAKSPRPASPDTAPASGGAHHKSWHDMAPAQQAGILCADKTFHRFLTETVGDGFAVLNEIDAVTMIHDYCKVSSRRDIIPGGSASKNWSALVADYRAWMREPAVVPA